MAHISQQWTPSFSRKLPSLPGRPTLINTYLPVAVTSLADISKYIDEFTEKLQRHREDEEMSDELWLKQAMIPKPIF